MCQDYVFVENSCVVAPSSESFWAKFLIWYCIYSLGGSTELNSVCGALTDA